MRLKRGSPAVAFLTASMLFLISDAIEPWVTPSSAPMVDKLAPSHRRRKMRCRRGSSLRTWPSMRRWWAVCPVVCSYRAFMVMAAG